MRSTRQIITMALVCAAVVSSRPAGAQFLVNGAGATFPTPLYTRWFNTYARIDQSVRFNYQSVGSGAGIAQIISRQVDFGASDAPMNDKQLAEAPGKILHFPTVLGADVITYNLPQLTEPLRFTGPVVADIFLGKITKWNDQAIVVLNPNAKLPDVPIVVCHRSDGSGTTYVFADYLSKVSPEWASKVGRGTSLSWPVGFGGNGNQGVTELLKQTAGAIGYVELAYAIENHLPASRLKNHDGNWVEANTKTVTSAAASEAATMPSDFRVSITDAPGADSYPISSFTYLLIYEQQKDGTKGKALVEFIEWMLHDGQNFTIPLSYAPLPGSVIAAEEKQLKMIKLAAQ